MHTIGNDDAALSLLEGKKSAATVPMVVPAAGEPLSMLSNKDFTSMGDFMVGPGCKVCDDIRPVYRRFQPQQALYNLRMLDCSETSASASPLCSDIAENETPLPLLHLYDECRGSEPSLLHLDPFIEDSYDEAVKYGYDEKRHTFSSIMYALLAIEGASGTSAPVVTVSGASGQMAFLNGDLKFMVRQGRPYWKRGTKIYLRWIPGTS